VRGAEDFEAVFGAATQSNAQAVLVFDDPLTIVYSHRIVALAASSRFPAMYGFRNSQSVSLLARADEVIE
jgi:hypothetical protein